MYYIGLNRSRLQRYHQPKGFSSANMRFASKLIRKLFCLKCGFICHTLQNLEISSVS